VKIKLPSQFIFLSLVLLFSAGFWLFYWRYVPLVKPFQLALAPLLILTAVVTAVRLPSGLLLFSFLFPLINNLPYFFGIQENIPHAPTALVLFLAFTFGWLVNKALKPSLRIIPHPVFRPVFVFAAIVLVSGVVTFLRYANFFPLLTPAVRELVVNANGVRAGGALMSTVFNTLNYLSGFLFFFILMNELKSEAFLRKIMAVLAGSFGISILFSLVQRFVSAELGNTAFWVRLGRLNATFKDPNSFGAFVAAFLPLLLAMSLSTRGRRRGLFLALALLALFVFPSSGSRSGLIGLLVSVLVFFLLLWLRIESGQRKKLAVFPALAVLFFLLIFSFSIFSTDLSLFKRFEKRIDVAEFFNRRLEFWGVASFMIGDYPLTGVGAGGFIIELPNFSRQLKLPFRWTDSAGNYLFQVGAEFGFVGLLLALWLFTEIIRGMWSGWRKIPAREPPPFFLLGAFAGTVSLLVNFLFHTYIGSFEVHYLFWLLVAVILRSSRLERTDEASVRPTPKFIAACLAGVALFGLVHLWNSTHSLSLKERTRVFGWDQNFGLYKRERDIRRFYFCWTQKSAGITVDNRGGVLVVPLLASHPDIERNPVTVRVSITDPVFQSRRPLQEIILRESRWVDFELDLSSLPGEKTHLLFEVERTWQPLKHSGQSDPRHLGIALGEVWSRFPDAVPVEKTAGTEVIPASRWGGPFKQNLWSDGVSLMTFQSGKEPVALRLHIRGTKAYDIGPYLIVKVDDRLVGRTMLTREGWTALVFEPALQPGAHVLSVEFNNDVFTPDRKQDRNVFLGDLEIISLKP
jgi:O-antigen ligase